MKEAVKAGERSSADTATRFSLLYATRERYPSHLFDLTELISVGLAGKGHCVDWVMQDAKGGGSRTLEASETERFLVGRSTSRSSSLSRLLDFALGLLHDIRILRYARQRRYDFIQVRDKPFAGLAGLLAARSSGARFIYWMSFPYPEADMQRVADFGPSMNPAIRFIYRLRGRLTGWLLYRFLLPKSDFIFVQSDQMRRDVSAQGIDWGKMKPVPMGINVARVEEARDRVEANRKTFPGRLPVVYAGTLMRLRRLDVVVRAFKKLHDRIPEALLILVGTGDPASLAFLRDEVSAQKLTDHVIFTGFIPVEEVWSYVRSAKVCVTAFPSNRVLNPGTPTKIIEYLAWCRPVVASEHPDQTKVLEESGAGLSVPFTEDAFAEAIEWLLRNQDEAEVMAAKGMDYVKKHRDYAALSRDLEQSYLAVLSGAATGSEDASWRPAC